MTRLRQKAIIFISTLLVLVPFMRIANLRASMSFTADDQYLYGSVTAYLTDGATSMELSGPAGTFNKSNAGSAYIEGNGKITINYGYMAKGSTYTIRLYDSNGAEVTGDFTFFLKANSGTKGTFLVPPPNDVPTPTPIPSPTPTPTPIPDATPTPVPPIVVNTPTPSPVPTNTPTAVPTDTPTPTPSDTPTPTPTPTVTPESTATPVPTESPTPTPIPTETTTENTTVPPSVNEQTHETDAPRPTVANYEVKKAVADILPGVYITDEYSVMRVSWSAFIWGLFGSIFIGFAIMFLFKLREGDKEIAEHRFFKGSDELYVKDNEEDDSK